MSSVITGFFVPRLPRCTFRLVFKKTLMIKREKKKWKILTTTNVVQYRNITSRPRGFFWTFAFYSSLRIITYRFNSVRTLVSHIALMSTAARVQRNGRKRIQKRRDTAWRLIIIIIISSALFVLCLLFRTKYSFMRCDRCTIQTCRCTSLYSTRLRIIYWYSNIMIVYWFSPSSTCNMVLLVLIGTSIRTEFE